MIVIVIVIYSMHNKSYRYTCNMALIRFVYIWNTTWIYSKYTYISFLCDWYILIWFKYKLHKILVHPYILALYTCKS